YPQRKLANENVNIECLEKVNQPGTMLLRTIPHAILFNRGVQRECGTILEFALRAVRRTRSFYCCWFPLCLWPAFLPPQRKKKRKKRQTPLHRQTPPSR